jgi:hypothetical protein
MIDKRLALPLAGLGAALLASQMFFAMASRIPVPVRPEELHAASVHIDHVERTMQRFDLLTRPGTSRQYVTLLTSDDYPGVTFRLMGAARHVSVPVQAALEMRLTRDPAEAAETHRQFPNFSTQIDVLGVRHGENVLADPEPSYRVATVDRGRYTMWGQAALLASAILAALTIGIARSIRQRGDRQSGR